MKWWNKFRNIYIFHNWTDKLFLEEDKVPRTLFEACPPHIDKVQQYAVVLSLKVSLFKFTQSLKQRGFFCSLDLKNQSTKIALFVLKWFPDKPYSAPLIYVMSCHCPNRLSLSMGLQGVAAGANPSLVSGRGQGAPWTSDEQCGVQYLAQGHFDMQLSPARSWDLNQWPSDH